MKSDDKLDKDKIDFVKSATKSIVGAIPIAGSLLSELIENLIPNQRIDRLTKYIRELNKRLEKIPIQRINSSLGDDGFIDLFEEGFVQASRAISDERRQYIASIVVNGISNESVSFQESKFLLKILDEINDIEIIWLRFYLNPLRDSDKVFRNKHSNVLTKILPSANDENEVFQKAAFQKSYQGHLERLDLVVHKIRVDRKSGLPEFDKNTGKPKISYTEVTVLGKLLLLQIGLTSDKDLRFLRTYFE
jgi:hypothetical protein